MELPLFKDVGKQENQWKIMTRFARVCEVKNSDTEAVYETACWTNRYYY